MAEAPRLGYWLRDFHPKGPRIPGIALQVGPKWSGKVGAIWDRKDSPAKDTLTRWRLTKKKTRRK